MIKISLNTFFLAIIDSSEFNYKNKIGEFKYIGIKDLVNNIRNNTISEIDAKKDLNALKEIKNVEIIKYKKHTAAHKKLLNLFNDLPDIILTDKTLKSENQKYENKKIESRKEENEDEDYKNKYENEDEYDYYKMKMKMTMMMMMKMMMMMMMMMKQWIKTKKNKIIKRKNNNLDEIIDKSKSFEEQIKLLKKKRRSKRVLAL